MSTHYGFNSDNNTNMEGNLIHRIVVTPAFRKDGRYHCTQGGPKFHSRFQGELICTSVQPLTDSARILKARGVKGAIQMWHENSLFPSMTLQIEIAAGLTIQEGNRGLTLAKYKPLQGRPVGAQATRVPAYFKKASGELTAVQGIESKFTPQIASNATVPVVWLQGQP